MAGSNHLPGLPGIRILVLFRLAAVVKQAQQGSVPLSKVDQVREEVEDAMAKMEQTRVRCC